jgi:hypothetical protein
MTEASWAWLLGKLAHDAGAAALHELLDFLLRGHRGVAGRGAREGPVGRAVVDGELGVVLREEAELEARGERVAAADAVEDLEARVGAALVELAVVPEDGGPVVDRGGVDVTERGGGDLEVGEFRTAVSIMALKASVSMCFRSSAPLTAKPSEAVKSSSLPIMTSTYLAISRFTSCAFLRPPMVFQSEGR